MSERPKAMQPGETAEDVAARLLAEHGPPPQRVVDLVQGMQRQAAARRTA